MNAYDVIRFILSLFFLVSCNVQEPSSKSVVKMSQEEIEARARLANIAEPSLDTTDFHTLSDSVRKFINETSEHNMQKGFTLSTSDITGMANAVADYVEGKNEMPVLFCGHRAQMVRVLMEAYGYKTRLVNVVTSKFTDVINGHVFMEAFNPEANDWEVIDADFDSYWSNNQGERLSVSEVVSMNLEDFSPCNASGCSWANVSREGIDMMRLRNDGMLGAVLITGEGQHLLVNPERFDVLVKYSGVSLKKLFPEFPIKAI